MTFFFIMAVFLTLQSLWSLYQGFQFLKLVRRSLRQEPIRYNPSAALIIPCKGRDEHLERNAVKFLGQDYPSCQLIFVVAEESDPAHAYISSLSERHKEAHPDLNVAPQLIVAGYSGSNGEKVNNLLAGLKAVEDRAEVLAFADIDASPRPDWLRNLIGPLHDSAVTLSTGFRWYLPGAGFTSRLRSAWNSSIATMLSERDPNFAWGGSMAMRKVDFQRLGIRERYWQGTVSDDYAIARAVRESGGAIRFEPRCLLASHSAGSFWEFLRWTNRQIIITRVYHARAWWMGLASYGLYAVTFVWGLAMIVLPGAAGPRAAAAAFLAGITVLGMSKGKMRTMAARELFPEQQNALDRYGACYWQLSPLVPWLMLFNLVTAGFVRRIEWSGTVYELRSINELIVIRRGAS